MDSASFECVGVLILSVECVYVLCLCICVPVCRASVKPLVLLLVSACWVRCVSLVFSGVVVVARWSYSNICADLSFSSLSVVVAW